VDTATVTTSALSAVYHFNQSAAGTYTVNVVINTDQGSTKGKCDCSVKVTVKPAPTPPVTPPVTPTPPTTPPTTPKVQAATTLPNTGPGDIGAMFVGTSAFGGVGHYLVSRRKR